MKFFAFLLTISVLQASAQSDSAAIKATINRFFQGMKARDTALIRSAVADGALLQSVTVNKDGRVGIKNESFDAFIQSVSKAGTQVLDERIVFETIKQDGDLAAVWTPYRFYLDENFSHCGVNSFQLVRLLGGWKIQYVIDTRRRQGCSN